MYRTFSGVAMALLASTAIGAPADQSISIETRESAFVITVPVSRLTMTLPKGSLVQTSAATGGATANPRYFHFQESSRAMILSGWFEPARAFKGLKEIWAGETETWKRNGLPQATNVAFGQVGGWQTITYDVDLPNVTNSHIRAHLVRAGTWIDLHLSLTSKESTEESRKLLRGLLESIVVNEKN